MSMTRTRAVNVGNAERIASVAAGTALVAAGAFRRSRAGLGVAAAGAALVYRGVKGHCAVYEALGVEPGGPVSKEGNLGVKIDCSMPVDEQREKLYRFWRDFRNLPLLVPRLEWVAVDSGLRSRWRLRGPLGAPIEWEADIIADHPGELIAWRTAPGARVAHAGSVRFESGPGGATVIHVSMQYDPPGGVLGHMLGQVFGQDAGAQIDEALTRLAGAMARAHEDQDAPRPASADGGDPPSPR